ncbi:MAG: lysophospholipid acyltransferase family protein [Oscillatoria sp. PMC 1076.18]|nr:lysophospholipid acyltransferase family protein [Oscillatoria sp. PMC 1076.18]
MTKADQTVSISSGISPWLASIVYPLGCKVVLPAYFGRLEVTGQENIPHSGPVIVTPTHRSRWDALIVPYATGRYASDRDLRYMVSEDEIKGLQGWVIKRMGGFGVNTRHPNASSLRHASQLLCQGEAVVIFPEGNIYREKQVQPLKRGVALLALQAQAKSQVGDVKIVPVSIDYSQPCPSWGTDVTVKIGKALNVGEYDTATLKKSSQQLTDDLQAALIDIHEENLASAGLPLITV